MTFWEKVRKYANEKVKEAYCSRYGALKCRVCKLWSSEVGGCTIRFEDEFGFLISTCNQCGQETRWDERNGIVLVLADEQPRVIV